MMSHTQPSRKASSKKSSCEVSKAQKGGSPQPPAAISLFGEPALTQFENRAQYDQLVEQLIETLRPDDVIEMMYVRQIADELTKDARLRRVEVDMVDMGVKAGKDVIVRTHGKVGLPLIKGASESRVQEVVQDALATNHLQETVFAAEAFRRNANVMYMADQMLSATVLRRTRAFEGLEDYRATKPSGGQAKTETLVASDDVPLSPEPEMDDEETTA